MLSRKAQFGDERPGFTCLCVLWLRRHSHLAAECFHSDLQALTLSTLILVAFLGW